MLLMIVIFDVVEGIGSGVDGDGQAWTDRTSGCQPNTFDPLLVSDGERERERERKSLLWFARLDWLNERLLPYRRLCRI
jgi:hypothetical protein